MKNFKKIISAITTAFMLINCISCSDISNNHAMKIDTETTNIVDETIIDFNDTSIYDITLNVTSNFASWNDPYQHTIQNGDMKYYNGEVLYIVYFYDTKLFDMYSNEGSGVGYYDYLPGNYTIKAYYDGSVIGEGSYTFGICSHDATVTDASRIIENDAYDETYHLVTTTCEECGEILDKYEEEHYIHNDITCICLCGYVFLNDSDE